MVANKWLHPSLPVLQALLLLCASCAAPVPSLDCGPGGVAHDDHCHCEEGYVLSKGRCGPAEGVDGGGADAGPADAGNAEGVATCGTDELLVDGNCLRDDADGCGPRGVLHGSHCHCDAGTYEASGARYCVAPGACSRADDAYEPNDTPQGARAFTVGAGAVEGFVCPGNDDWFSLRLASGQEVEVELDFLHAEGDLDVYLWQSGADVSHARPLAGSDSEDDDEAFRFTAPADDTYWLLVYGHQGAQAGYRLTVR